MIVGIGVDIVEIERINKLIDRGKNKFCERYFSADEIGYCEGKALQSQHYAGKFAAKEAIVKALNFKGSDLVELKKIIISNDGDGIPRVRLQGNPRRRAEAFKVTDIHISISHCREYAVAMAVLTGGD